MKWKLVSVRFDIVLISMQDRCMVCAKRTLGSEISLDRPDDTLRDMGDVEARFSLFGDSVNLDARKVHSLC